MSFQISALPAEHFTKLAKLDTGELVRRHIHKSVADVHPGIPCRVSLQDAAMGETVYLLNYAHHDHDTPYKSSHAIFVRQGATEARLAADEIPLSLTSRLLSVRAFDQSHDMVDADITEGTALAPMITAMFENKQISYLHLHNARPGCYAARVDRV